MIAVQNSVTRWGRAGALYDLVASAAFLTPWTAALALDLIGTPRPDAMSLLFATLFVIRRDLDRVRLALLDVAANGVREQCPVIAALSS